MEAASALVDFTLSLEYATKTLSEHKEYRELVKVTDAQYLEHIDDYQEFLQDRKDGIANWVTDEYNIAYYLLLDRSLSSFHDMNTAVQELDRDAAFSLISTYVLDSEQEFHVHDLIGSALSDKNRWRLTELYYDFDKLKDDFSRNLMQAWRRYKQLKDTLSCAYERKISQETARVSEKSDELYSIVYKNYISREDFNAASKQIVLLASLDTVLYVQKGEEKYIGIGVYTFDCLKLVHDANSYGQEFREKILKALADPTRFGILKLIDENITSNKIIAHKFGISSAAVTYQLKYLLDNHIITSDAQSKKLFVNKKLLAAVLAGIEKELHLNDEQQ